MMAHKALLFGDMQCFEQIVAARKPAEAKELGRQVLSFDEVIWRERRYEIVKQGNIHKFNQNPRLKAFLLDSKSRILVEASPVDEIWGIGLAADSAHIDIAADNGFIQFPLAKKVIQIIGFILSYLFRVTSDVNISCINPRMTPPSLKWTVLHFTTDPLLARV